MSDSMLPMVVSLVPLAGALVWGRRRLRLSLAKHPSLAGHSRWAKRVARLIPGYAYDEDEFFGVDGAPEETVARRRAGFSGLADRLARRHPKSIARSMEAAAHLSDLQFTRAYRVPFQFSPFLRSRLKLGGFVEASGGVEVVDLDGQHFIDLTGSYGVNVMGYDFYKECMAEAAARVGQLGPVLGALHPCAAWNAERLCRISGKEEVSFHMSGTEAVMQAVRLARYHTGRQHLVRFCGSYHGWWDDVQPGPGNPMPPGKTYTLKERSRLIKGFIFLRTLDQRTICDLLTDLAARIERTVRILEDHLQTEEVRVSLSASDLLNRPTVEDDIACCAIKDPDDCLAQSGLTATRFTDETDDLPCTEL